MVRTLEQSMVRIVNGTKSLVILAKTPPPIQNWTHSQFSLTSVYGVSILVSILYKRGHGNQTSQTIKIVFSLENLRYLDNKQHTHTHTSFFADSTYIFSVALSCDLLTGFRYGCQLVSTKSPITFVKRPEFVSQNVKRRQQVTQVV